MDDLPDHVLAHILSFIDPLECVSYSRVASSLWKCLAHRHSYAITLNTLRSYRNLLTFELMGSESSFLVPEEMKYHQNIRAKGHLPDPVVLIDQMKVVQVEEKRFEENKKKVALVSRLEDVDQTRKSFVTSIDLSTSLLNGKSIAKTLVFVNMSGLQFLKRLRVRGCSLLKHLIIPTQLIAIDAHSCSHLLSIQLRTSSEHTNLSASLRMLNLNGCRQLKISQSSDDLFCVKNKALMKLIELDMTSVNNLSKSALAGCILQTESLRSVSFRYIADDEVLSALTRSTSTRNCLQMLDVAFSSSVTDASIEKIIKSASKLQSLNLRGCPCISSGCYNLTALYLSKRRKRDDMDFSISKKGRKGDVLFNTS